MNFKINDKVVCVDDKPGTKPWKYEFPSGRVKKGVVYVVEDVKMILFKNGYFERVFIVGCPAIRIRSGRNDGWQPWRFRRLEEIQAENRERAQRKEPVSV